MQSGELWSPWDLCNDRIEGSLYPSGFKVTVQQRHDSCGHTQKHSSFTRYVCLSLNIIALWTFPSGQRFWVCCHFSDYLRLLHFFLRGEKPKSLIDCHWKQFVNHEPKSLPVTPMDSCYVSYKATTQIFRFHWKWNSISWENLLFESSSYNITLKLQRKL